MKIEQQYCSTIYCKTLGQRSKTTHIVRMR